jgi:hypothetical protein
MIEVKHHGFLFKPDMVRANLRDVDPKTQTRRVITFENSRAIPRITRKQWPELKWDMAVLGYEDGIPFWYVPMPFRPVIKVTPRVQPGDVIWVKETIWVDKRDPKALVIYAQDPRYYKYKVDGKLKMCRHDHGLKSEPLTLEEAQHAVESNKHWKRQSSMLMPRWASRTDLLVTAMRSERVQQISEADAISEGLKRVGFSGLSGYPLFSYNANADHKKHHTKENEETYDVPSMGFRSLWDSINKPRGFGWSVNPPVWVHVYKRVTT